MGWEDESDNPESNQRRAALEMKQSNAEQRKKKAIATKFKKIKNKESSERSSSSKKPPSGKSSNGKSSSGSKTNGKAGGSNGDSARTNNTGRGGDAAAATAMKRDDDDDDGGEVPSVENLLKIIERLRYKNETLDTAWKRADHENANVTMALQRVEHQLSGQQEKYDVDVGKLRKRVGTMQDRVSIVTRLETGLLELCLEVRDRSADDLSSSGGGGGHGGGHGGGGGGDGGGGESDPMRRHERSKNDLLKQCNNDVLVILDHLRANVRIQLAFKEDYEKELKGTLERRYSSHVQELKKMDDEKIILHTELHDANQRVNDAEKMTDLATDDKTRVAKECENMIFQWRKKLTNYESLMNKKDMIVEALTEQLDDAFNQIKNGDSKQCKRNFF